jgi:predicted nucleic acid-binding Zn ribbon protein
VRRTGRFNERAIGEVLPAVYKNLGLEERMDYVLLAGSWKDIVGENIFRHSKPVGVVNRCLIVEVDSPVWLNELNSYSKSDILRKVKEKNKVIRDIRFKIGMM